jgi:hypothetical protein
LRRRQRPRWPFINPGRAADLFYTCIQCGVAGSKTATTRPLKARFGSSSSVASFASARCLVLRPRKLGSVAPITRSARSRRSRVATRIAYPAASVNPMSASLTLDGH